MVTRMILNETSYFGFGAIEKIVDELKANNLLNQLATLTNEVKDLKTKLSNSDIQAANVEKAIGEFKNIKNLLLEFDSSIDSTEDIKVKRQLIRNIVKSVKYNEVDKTFFIEFYHP